MNMTYPISSLGELIGEPARTTILISLLDGNSLPAGELARLAGISAQSASAHLSKLVDGGLLAPQNDGRHRYYKITSPEVVHALEALGAIATLPRPTSTFRSREDNDISQARSCYDHLAGHMAVELTRALHNLKVIRSGGTRDYKLGPKGPRWFADLGIDVLALARSRRVFARRCLDWTERQPHLAGALGAALFSRMLDAGWIARRGGTRALRVTHRGARELQTRFGLTVKPA
ncbi:MAG TPA: winged helix-turn-helix domain-containing protein [Candidatus Binatus sp.]|jgi:DNA-binding transcriptional ArsR family regulator|nr:winged helix-turn-helix domain-containing protein [Candidatus Binatus sp.]